MKNILITDTHFGTKQGSLGWLNSQLEFFTQQFIPYIKEQDEPVRIIHLGDVFDSRSSIPVIHAQKIQALFAEIAGQVDEFIIIGGNHDYYSPNSSEFCTLDVLLGNIPNIELVTHGMLVRDRMLFVPWYSWLNDKDMVVDMVKMHRIHSIFTHADIVHEQIDPRLRGKLNIFSGHIHTPDIKEDTYLFNLGSTFALSFADCNAQRGFWTFQDGSVEFIPNERSINFHRIKDSEVFEDLFPWYDYVELYISTQNVGDPAYVERIKECNGHYKHFWVIPIADAQTTEVEQVSDSDIITQIEECVPDYLIEKFKQVIKEDENNE